VKSRFGKEHSVVTGKLKRNSETDRWNGNTTADDHFIDKFGGGGDFWKNLAVKILKFVENVRATGGFLIG
jgi:hypothetical protein